MTGFRSDLDLRLVGWRDGRPVFMTLAPLRYQTDWRGGAIIVVPAKFVTDLASVPRLPILWLATGGRGPRSAVIHDFSYQFGFWPLDDGGRAWATKEETDRVFHESLVADPMSGAGRVRAWEMWVGVRLNITGGIWGDRARTVELNPIWSARGVPAAP